MQINWKVRFKNKAWLTAFAAAVLTLVYDILGMCGALPAVSEDTVAQIIMLLMNLLVMLGVVVDPTSSGVTDSANAMTYEQPNCVKCTDPDTELSQDGGDAAAPTESDAVVNPSKKEP